MPAPTFLRSRWKPMAMPTRMKWKKKKALPFRVPSPCWGSASASAFLLAGLPPLSGFLAKFAILHGLFDPESGGASEITGAQWTYVTLLILSGLAAMIALNRIGIRTFWNSIEGTIPRVYLIEITPVLVLLAACVFLSIQAGPAMRFMDATAKFLAEPQ